MTLMYNVSSPVLTDSVVAVDVAAATEEKGNYGVQQILRANLK